MHVWIIEIQGVVSGKWFPEVGRWHDTYFDGIKVLRGHRESDPGKRYRLSKYVREERTKRDSCQPKQ